VVATNTMLASAAGAMAAYFYMKLKYGKPDPTMLCNGMLAGMVAITAPCAFVTAPASILIGGVAGVLVIWAALFIENTLKVDDPVGADPDAEETGATPEGELLQLELSARISTAMRTLSAEQRAVIQLNYFHGFDYPEIAAIVDCPLGTVKTRMFHARRKLERLLAGEREYFR